MTKKTKGKFCVINDTIGSNRCGRTILATEDQAIAHAQVLLNEDRNRYKPTPVFYVVEIKRIVSVGQVPIHVSSPAKIPLKAYQDD